MVLPCVVLLAVFAYRPVLASVELSLFGSDILGRPTRFVALEHYAALFTDPDLRRMVLVTLAIAALSTALAIGAGLAAALPLRRAGRGAGAVSVLLSLPFAYSAAADMAAAKRAGPASTPAATATRPWRRSPRAASR
jgi:sn-glycerol 3-phosphate transport system permease protein